jgi:hypothetical protein
MAYNHQKRLYQALKSECEADINEALLSLDLCFNNGTAIGEHTTNVFLEEASKALTKLTDGRDRLDTLDYYFDNKMNKTDKKQLNG